MKVNYNSWESDTFLRLLDSNNLLNGFDGLKRAVENICSEAGAVVSAGEEIIRMLEKSISDMLAAIKNLQSEVATLRSKLASVPRTETVKKQVPDGYGNMKTVTETRNINQGVIAQLNAEIEEKSSKIQSLQSKVDKLEAMKTEAQRVVNELAYCNGYNGPVSYARDDAESKCNSFRDDLDVAKKCVRHADACMERYNRVITRDGYYSFSKIPSKRG